MSIGFGSDVGWLRVGNRGGWGVSRLRVDVGWLGRHVRLVVWGCGWGVGRRMGLREMEGGVAVLAPVGVGTVAMVGHLMMVLEGQGRSTQGTGILCASMWHGRISSQSI